jgi:spore germination protein KB
VDSEVDSQHFKMRLKTVIEKGKISNRQAVLLLVAGVLSTGLLVFPSLITAVAGPDAWLAVSLAAGVALVVILITVSLNTRFPGKTIVEYSEDILGKLLGKTVGAVFIWFFLFLTALAVREFGEFMTTVFFEETPLVVFASSILLVAALAVYNGLEVIGRVNEMMLALVLIAFFFFMLLATNQMEPDRLTPVLAGGLPPLLQGAFIASGWFGEVVAIGFLAPYLNHPALARRIGVLSILILLGILIVAVVAAVMSFGPAQSGRMQFPTFMIARSVSIMNIFERAESTFMLLWVAGMFAKITVYYYYTALAIGQWFKLNDYRPLTLPLGTIIGALVFLSFTNNPEVIGFIQHVWSPYSLPIELGLPALLLITVVIRGQGGRKE